MADFLQLPALSAIEGQQADFNWLFLSDYPAPNSPVDLTGWTATFTVSTNIDGPAVVTTTPTLGAGGDISVTLTAAELSLLPTAPKIGGRISAYYQLNLNAPSPEFNQVWQGGLSIARGI